MDHYYTDLDGINSIIHKVAGVNHNWNKMANFDVTKDKSHNTYRNTDRVQFGVARTPFGQTPISPERITVKNDHILVGQARKPRNLLPKAVMEPAIFQIDAFDLKNNYDLNIQIDRMSELNKSNIAVPKQAFSFSVKEWGRYPEDKREELKAFLEEQKKAGLIEKIQYSPDHTVNSSFLRVYMNKMNNAVPDMSAKTTVSTLQNGSPASVNGQSPATKGKSAVPPYPHYLKQLATPINKYKKDVLSLSDKVIAAAIFAGVEKFILDDVSYIISGHISDNSLKQTVRNIAMSGQIIESEGDAGAKSYSLIALPKDMSPDVYERAVNGFEGKDWTKEKRRQFLQDVNMNPPAPKPKPVKNLIFFPSPEKSKKSRKNVTSNPYHLFASVPPYLGPDKVPQSERRINAQKSSHEFTNSDKVIAAAICHASLGETFRSIDLTKTIKEGVADTSIQTFVGKIVKQGFLKVVSREGSNKYLTLAEMPADMNEERYYKIIKDFKGVPQVAETSLEEKVTTSIDDSLVSANDHDGLSDQQDRHVAAQQDNLLKTAEDILKAAAGTSEEELISVDASQNENAEVATATEKNGLTSVHNILITEVEANNTQPSTPTDEQNVKQESPTIAQAFVAAPPRVEFSPVPSGNIVTDVVQANSVQAMALKNIGSRAGKNDHVAISQYIGPFPMQFGETTLYATGRSTRIDFHGIDSSITVVNFDSMVQDKLPYVIIRQPDVQATPLNGHARTAELFQHMKHLLVPPANDLNFMENEMAIGGLQQLRDNRQSSLASYDIFKTVSSLTQGLTQ